MCLLGHFFLAVCSSVGPARVLAACVLSGHHHRLCALSLGQRVYLSVEKVLVLLCSLVTIISCVLYRWASVSIQV
jgi:hypothetical protein